MSISDQPTNYIPQWICFSNGRTFISVFGRICTTHAQKLLFLSFRSNLWHCRWIGRPLAIDGFGGHLPCDFNLWAFDLEHLHMMKLYQILAKSNNPQLSYSDLKIGNFDWRRSYFRFGFGDGTRLERWKSTFKPNFDISIHGRDKTTSGLGKRTAAILEFYFRFFT